ncbi:MAG: hypothetical protein ACFFF9_08420 [Candidatus Thorarchaeota archaeon]
MESWAHTTKTIVENLHNTWLYRTIEEWTRRDALEIREELGLESFSVTSSDSVEMYSSIKQHILSKTIHDKETLDFLMKVPNWVGFSLDENEFRSGQQVIGAAREEAIAMLWLMALPKIIISPKTMPEEYPIDAIHGFIKRILDSDASRTKLRKQMSTEMERRGIPDIVFNPNPIGRGYVIDESMREQRLRALIALVVMKSSGCPFDLDAVFSLDENEIVEEATANIVTMHAQNMLNNQITGGGGRRPFDWPLIGNPEICARLFVTLDILAQSATKMTSCSMFSSTINAQKAKWRDLDFIAFLVEELVTHYAEIKRTRLGRGQNHELSLFVDLINEEKLEIAARLLESDKIGQDLFDELTTYKQRAKTGERPDISPERRFGAVLSNLKQSLEEEKLESIDRETIIDQVDNIFDALVEVVESHLDSLGEEAERFTQALCFETSIRLIQLLGLGEALMDLPWVSRFIAEESARTDITEGDLTKLDDEHRIKRIVSAYAGGVTYVILQFQSNLK